jgi:hypothetical protein
VAPWVRGPLDLSAKPFDSGSVEVATSHGLCLRHQVTRLTESTGLQLGEGSSQRPVDPPLGLDGQGDRALEERCGRGEPRASLRSCRGLLQLRGELLIRPDGRR